MARTITLTGLWMLWRLMRSTAIAVFALGLCLCSIVAIATWQRALDFPDDYRELLDARDKGSATFYAADGAYLGLRGPKYEHAGYVEMAPVMVDAILATEDTRFFWHTGVDPIGIARALWTNWRAGWRTKQGGSSITQQVAKSFVGAEQNLERKLRELAFAFALEYKYSKFEIFEMYINRVYLGAGAWGVRAAAKTYFNAEVGEISPAQAAMLAGLLRAPSKWSPTSDFEASKTRAKVILDRMLFADKLDEDAYLLARLDIELMAPPPVSDETAPYFLDWALEQVPSEVWAQADDVIVKTTLTPAVQTASEQAIEKVFAEHAGRDAGAQAALVMLGKDGAVIAMVGGRDYGQSEFNRAASSRRQLGSAFKPFVYAAAFKAGVSAGASVLDQPITIRTKSGKPWSPRNYSRRYLGRIPLSVALARSSNVASVRMMLAAGGVSPVIDLAEKAGFVDHIPPFPSLALGVIETNPLEVASAYAVFNSGGKRTPAYGILEITDRRGQVLWRFEPQEGEQVMPFRHAEWMVGMLRGVVEAGTGRRAQLDEERPAAGKTGTTQNYSDAWFAGFTADFVAVVWMGNDKQEIPLHRVTGGSIPAMIWKEIMTTAHTGLPIGLLAESSVPESYETIGGGEPAARTSRRRTRRSETRSGATRTRRTERSRQAEEARRRRARREERRRRWED